MPHSIKLNEEYIFFAAMLLIPTSRVIKSADFITLEVGINNIAAKNMYSSFNFIECGIRKNYYRNSSGSREDAIIMKLNLN